MAKKDEDKHVDRRGFLQCMAWVGTGAVWTMSSGVLKGMPLGQSGRAAMAHAGSGGLQFVQISDSHIGFDKPANTDVTATLRAAIAKIMRWSSTAGASPRPSQPFRVPTGRRCPRSGTS